MAKTLRNVMFTGGVPADTVADVFTMLSESVGGRAIAYPDGEIGERSGWISAINNNVFPDVKGLERVETPYAESHPFGKMLKTHKIADGVKTVDLTGGKLPYARGAIESYAIFKRMREEGKIPEGVRFQMSIPGAHDVIAFTFPNVSDWPRMYDAWGRALQDEYRKMLEVIPANELCIQIDFCLEFIQIGGAMGKATGWIPQKPEAEEFKIYTAKSYIGPQVASLPDDVMLGIHICAGTFPEFPMLDEPDIGLAVRIADALTANIERRIDFFHMPVYKHSKADYFKPLESLKTKDAKIFLGLECNDGLENMERRIADAQKHLHDFGVAHYCGYLWNKAVMGDLLKTLAKGADKLAASS